MANFKFKFELDNNNQEYSFHQTNISKMQITPALRPPRGANITTTTSNNRATPQQAAP